MNRLAFNLYLLFTVSWFLHLAARFPLLAPLHIDLLLLCAIAAGALADPAVDETCGDRRVRSVLVVLVVWAILSIPFVEWPGSVVKNGLPEFLKAAVFYYFTVRLVNGTSRLKRFLALFVACQTFRVVEPWYLHVTNGYWGGVAVMSDWTTMDRLAGAPSDVVNANGLAFIVVTVVPFLHYLAPMTRVGTAAYALLLPLLLNSLLLTGSRSGLLGLVLVVAGIWLKSRHKVLVGSAVAVGVLVAVSSLSANLGDRYRSLISSDTRNSATAEGRVAGAEEDLIVAARRPIFGHGLGTSREVNVHFEQGRDQPSHILYGEVAQELGFVGLVIVVAFIAAIAASVATALRELRTAPSANPLLIRLGHALQVWLWMDVLFSFASYGLSSYEWYLTAGLAQVLSRGVREATGRTADEVPRAGRAITGPSSPGSAGRLEQAWHCALGETTR